MALRSCGRYNVEFVLDCALRLNTVIRRAWNFFLNYETICMED